jgi:hypothetical protein
MQCQCQANRRLVSRAASCRVAGDFEAAHMLHGVCGHQTLVYQLPNLRSISALREEHASLSVLRVDLEEEGTA